MTFSRFLGILSAISAAAAALAAYTQAIKPEIAVISMGFSVVVNAFTERVQGSKDNFRLTEDERAIIEIHREKERMR